MGNSFGRTFAVSWVAYAALYLCRKNFSVLMPFLKEQGYTAQDLGQAVFYYSLAYMLGQFLTGRAADRSGSRIVVTIGMLVSAGASAVTGLAPWLGLIQFANGLGQSSGWP